VTAEDASFATYYCWSGVLSFLHYISTAIPLGSINEDHLHNIEWWPHSIYGRIISQTSSFTTTLSSLPC